MAELGNWILDKLERAILSAPELQGHLAAVRTETRDELAEERGFHERFIESRTRVYVGRQQLQDELKAFVAGAEAKPCLVTGPSGSGKSAALAKFCQLSTLPPPQCYGGQVNPQPLVAPKPGEGGSTTLITHFVGASPRSTGLRDVLRHLCAELKDALKLEDEIKQDTRELCDQFRKFLAKVPADRRVVLVIDALNQLDEADNAHSLYWLPRQIPPPVRLIVSCIDDPDRTDQPALAAMRSRQPHEIKVGLLTDEERLGIVREIPSVTAKTLDQQQVRLLLANEATCNPLFLLVALEELRGFGSFEQLNQKIAGLPQTGDTLTAIFQQVIRRLGEDFNAATVKEVLKLLACARRGLSERELLDVIEGESIRIEESAGDLFPILRQLRPYLQSRGPLLDFYHRHLAKATHEEFFKSHDSVRLATHGRLSDYFVGCAKGSDPTREWETSGVRGFAECVFHLAQAVRHDHAAGLLTNFPFLLHKLRVGLLEGVFEDYDMIRREAPGGVAKRLEIWADFFREKAHILRRGNQEWPAHKILLQLAVEHADDSPLTLGAEQWLADGRCEWLWLRCVPRVPRVHKNPCLATLEGHTNYISGALELNDGRLLSWSWGRTLRLWDRQSGACLATLKGHTRQVRGVLALANGHLLSWSYDKTLRLWDSRSGACLATLEGHTNQVAGALALPNGHLLSWSNDKTLRLWDSRSGACLVVFQGHTDMIWGTLVLTDGRLLSWSADKTLRLWDSQSGACLATLEGHSDPVLSARVLTDGRLLSWSTDKTLRLWDSQSRACLATLKGHTDQVTGALALANGHLLSWSNDKTLRLWDSQSGACLATLEGHTHPVWGTLALADGQLLSWSRDGTLRLWDSQSGACLATLKGHSHFVKGALALADGRLLSWSADKTLRLWDGQRGACLGVLQGHTDMVWGTLVLTDGRLLSWSTDKTLRLWDSQSRASLRPLATHSKEVLGVLALANGRLLSWSNDKTLRLWDGQSGACLATLQGHTYQVTGALALANGHLLSWSNDKTLRLWDAQSGACMATLEGHRGQVTGALELADGRLLSRADDGTLRLWDGHSGVCLRVLEGHTHFVDGALALGNGRLVSWSRDKTLRLWNGQSGVCLATLEGHSDPVLGARVLTDGRLLSWSADKTLRLWDSQSGACLQIFKGHCWMVTGALVLGGGRLLSWSEGAGAGGVSTGLGHPEWRASANARRAHQIGRGCAGFGQRATTLVVG